LKTARRVKLKPKGREGLVPTFGNSLTPQRLRKEPLSLILRTYPEQPVKIAVESRDTAIAESRRGPPVRTLK
jgi:hypothetical protein